MLSNNAPQFKVADEMLQSLWSTPVHDDKVQSYLSDKSISWQYIPAHAPWMGGIYERLIGIVKVVSASHLDVLVYAPTSYLLF